ncbi:unnamed protein product [Peronospora farinosa]|uniref:Uncharacterized protein n=1 Tax=Peronospora farinosa TaxID=134698 RepID=A0AAV0STK8_9STRA|nr:unnamed protein product [Peronospora farinosa]
MGITGEPSAEQHKLQEEEEAQSKLLKEQEENEAQLKLLKEQEENEAQLKLLKEQEEKEAELKLLKEQEAQAKLQDEFKKLNDWKKISASFESQLKKAGGEEFKKMKQGGTYIVKQNLDELLDGWDPTAKVHKTLKKGKELSTVEEGKELSTLEEGKELSTVKKDELILTVPLRGLKNYLEILNVGKQMGEKSKDEVEMEKLIKSLLHDDSRRKESDSIEKFFKLKDALWPKNPLKRKSESPSDYARDRQRPRGE